MTAETGHAPEGTDIGTPSPSLRELAGPKGEPLPIKAIKGVLAVLLSPNIVRALMYVGIIIGSTVVFTTSATMVGTAYTSFVAETVGNHPKQALPRSDVPLPAETPAAAAPAQAQGVGEPVPLEEQSSITTLASADTAGASITAVAPADSSITAVAPPGTGQLRVTSDVTIRALPDKTGGALGTIGKGEIVTAEANDNGWIQISQNGAILGWVYQRYLAPAE